MDCCELSKDDTCQEEYSEERVFGYAECSQEREGGAFWTGLWRD